MEYLEQKAVERIKWCIWAFFIQYCVCVSNHCLVNSKLHHANMVVSLDGWLWAISSLSAKTTIKCLTEIHVVPMSLS